jgi:hypothetical protein
MKTGYRLSDSVWPWVAAGLFVAIGFWITTWVPIDDWRLLHGDSIRVFAPTSYVWETTLFNPFPGGQIKSAYLWMVAYYLGATTLFGMLLIQSVTRGAGTVPAAWPSLGYLAGYLALVFINRFITILFSHQWAVGLTLFAPLPPAVWFLWTQRLLARGDLRRMAVGALQLLLVFFVLLVFELEFGRNFMAGDSTIFFLRQLGNILPQLDLSAHLPLVDQQYDEVSYSYPLIFHSLGRSVFLFPFWVVNSLGKAAAVLVLYGFVCGRIEGKRAPWLAAIGILYLFLGSPTLRPIDYISLFGGQNPLVYNGHIGRMIGLVIPVLIIDLLGPRRASQGRSVALGIPAAILIGLGLGGTSVHNILFAGVFLVAAYVFAIWARSPNQKRSVSAGRNFAFLAFLLAAPWITYLGYWATRGFRGVLLIAALGLGAYLVFPPKRAWSWPQLRGGIFNQPFLSLLCVVVLAYAASVFLGNCFLPVTLQLLKITGLQSFFPSVYSEPFWSRHLVALAVKWFVPMECGSYPSYHCSSLAAYATYYGLFTFAAALLFWVFNRPQKSEASNVEFLFYHRLLLLLCVLFCWALFVTDFVNGPAIEWVKNRFTEIPYYLVFLILPIGIGQVRKRTNAIVLASLMLLWAVLPFVVNYGPQQWLVNFKYLLDYL